MNDKFIVVPGQEIPSLNDEAWYKEIDILKINRISLLSIVATIELTLRHPDIGSSLREALSILGKDLTLRLLGEGLILPENTLTSWRHTFQI